MTCHFGCSRRVRTRVAVVGRGRARTAAMLSWTWDEFSSSSSAHAASWACPGVRERHVLQHGPCCLLAATSISPRDPHLQRLLADLKELVVVHPWARALLNLFDEVTDVERTHIARSVVAQHPHIASSFVPGFKTLFWARVLTPSLVRPFTHLLLFDSDLVVRPSSFDLVGLLRIGEATNASLIQPSPYGTNAGMYSLGIPRCPESDVCKCSPRPSEKCVACRQPVIEVKVPLFTSAAWIVIHDELLAHVKFEALTSDRSIDLMCADPPTRLLVCPLSSHAPPTHCACVDGAACSTTSCGEAARPPMIPTTLSYRARRKWAARAL